MRRIELSEPETMKPNEPETDNNTGRGASRTGRRNDLKPHLRQFVELHLSGMTKLDAWAKATGKPKTPGMGAIAARSWKGKAVQAYLRELEERKSGPNGGEDALREWQAKFNERLSLLDAAVLSRENTIAWLQGVVFMGAKEIMEILEDPDASEADKIRAGAVCQSYKRKTTYTKAGDEVVTVEVSTVNKLGALRELSEMLNYAEPIKLKVLSESTVAKIRASLRDTTKD